MAKRVKKRTGKAWWRTVEIIGWMIATGGLLFLEYSLDGGIRATSGAKENLFREVIASATLFFGAMLALVARDFDTRWTCSSCQKELRAKEDAACLNCLVLLD